ncbi:AI-2E family transporter [Consotaella aegiceratis]|uniref:AI-2E family transporter n=1 Tax=Consotaella aegiceratis TaxID=3097961 RepID=UPI002F425664
MTSEERADLATRTFIVAGIVLAMGLIVLVFWAAALGFFLIFAGIVLAAAIAGLARPMQWLGLPRWMALLLVYFAIVAGIGAALAWGGITFVQDIQNLTRLMQEQLHNLVSTLQDMGIELSSDDKTPELGSFLPDASGFFSSASQAVFSVLGGLGNIFIVLFIAIFISWQPRLYARGIVSLFPKGKRSRIDEALRHAARELRLWLAGQAISMATIFVVGWIGLSLIGMPNAFLLALQAGLLAFIPTLGPFIAAIPIILVGLAESTEMALYGLAVYVVIQGVESNVSQPIAQRYTTALPPALTLGSQLVFGLLFGTVGLALAVPLLAVLMVFVQDLYVRDALGGPVDETA